MRASRRASPALPSGPRLRRLWSARLGGRRRWRRWRRAGNTALSAGYSSSGMGGRCGALLIGLCRRLRSRRGGWRRFSGGRRRGHLAGRGPQRPARRVAASSQRRLRPAVRRASLSGAPGADGGDSDVAVSPCAPPPSVARSCSRSSIGRGTFAQPRLGRALPCRGCGILLAGVSGTTAARRTPQSIGLECSHLEQGPSDFHQSACQARQPWFPRAPAPSHSQQFQMPVHRQVPARSKSLRSPIAAPALALPVPRRWEPRCGSRSPAPAGGPRGRASTAPPREPKERRSRQRRRLGVASGAFYPRNWNRACIPTVCIRLSPASQGLRNFARLGLIRWRRNAMARESWEISKASVSIAAPGWAPIRVHAEAARVFGQAMAEAGCRARLRRRLGRSHGNDRARGARCRRRSHRHHPGLPEDAASGRSAT